MITVADITEANTLRERILRAERLREAGEVAAGVAHNFNNLLTVIRSNAELMLLDLPEDNPARGKAEKIIRASEDGAKMVRRIRDTARQEPEQTTGTTTVNLNALIRDSIAFTEDYARSAQNERGMNIVLETDLAPDIKPVEASASELREVFVNLLRNAVDAVEGEGRIIVRSFTRDGETFAEVSDTGRGMSEEVLNKMFMPLFSTKGERGTGMGLATCYAIVRRHGGDIQVKSAQGAGTTFTVRLPSSHK
jgi:signal transduction histidine kinase